MRRRDTSTGRSAIRTLMVVSRELPLLTTALLLPIVGAVVVAVLPKRGRADLPKVVALGVSLPTLVVVAVVGDRLRHRRRPFPVHRDPRWIERSARTTRSASTASG